MTNSHADIPVCPPPDPNPTKPTFQVPAGACDTHAHIFPNEHVARYSPRRGYTPPVAGLSTFLELHDVLGIERAVLTQPSVYGTDNTAILEAVALYPERMKAVVAVDKAVSDDELVQLNAAGAKGIRVNLVDKGGMPFDDLEDVRQFTDRIAPLGWHLELLIHANDFPDLRRDFAELPVDIVVGHLGYMTTPHGLGDPGFRELLAMARDGACWVKLTGSYRITTADAPPYDDVVPFAQALIDAAPNRMLWGSDWPHPTYYRTMPNDGYLLDQLAIWTANDAERIKQILVDNPMAFYGFSV
ncbi:MAG: amidohydrolase family protein [Hyphomicrobiaceae bacterium]